MAAPNAIQQTAPPAGIDQAADHPDFAKALESHLQQIPPDQFQQQAQQAANQMPPEQQHQVAGDLLDALKAKGLDIGKIASDLGLGSMVPQQMGSFDLGKLLGWAHENHPDAVAQAAQNKPWFVQALGNPAVMGTLEQLAGRMFGG